MQYTIGQVSRLMGISAYTLRYYDKEGLLPFVTRAAGGVRLFDEADLEFLHVIDCLKNTGMALADIRAFIAWAGEGDKTLRQRYDLFEERMQAVEAQMAQLEAYRACIAFKRDYYRKALEAGTEAVHQGSAAQMPGMPLGRIVGKREETE